MSSILAWHFIRSDRLLRDGNTVAAGYVYEVEPPLEMCKWGLHASVRAIDALQYAPGFIVCRVRMSGEIEHDTDKLVATRREVLWLADAERTLHEFACWSVRHTPLADGRVVWDLLTDPRSRAAVETKERWLAGEATEKELFAAWAAAWDAAWAAAGAAARAAARAAAKAATRAATRDAAWAAAWDTAEAAAWDAAEAAQNAQLEKMLNALEPPLEEE